MASPTTAGKKILRVGILNPVHTLNPREARDLYSSIAVTQVFETPFETPKSAGPAVPLLFEGPMILETSGASGHVYSGLVRRGITFSDGTPLSASLAAASLSRVDDVRGIAQVEARADRVVFTTKAAHPRLDLLLATLHAGVALDRGGRLLGTGPYMAAPGATPDSVRLMKSPSGRVPVAIDEIVFQVYPPGADGRPDGLMKALAAGEVDFTTSLSRSDATEVSGVRKAFQPSISTCILFLNTERPELASPEVRRALLMAVDRMALTEVSYQNPLAFAAASPLPPSMATGRDGIPFDLARAKALLAEPGVVKPARLRLLTTWAPRPYVPHPQKTAEAIAQQLSALGIDVQVLKPRDSQEYFRRSQQSDYDMVLGGWMGDTPDPADFLEACLRSDRIPSPAQANVGGVNLARYRSPEMDAALRKYREDQGPANLGAVLARMAQDAPLLPIMHGPTVIVSSWKVKNVDVSTLGMPNFAAFDIDT